jgi:hypothetical protein
MEVFTVLFNADPSRLLTEDDFTSAANLLELVSIWRASIDERLVGYILGDSVTDGDADSRARTLDLATTFFHCSDCATPIGYPAIIVHRCRRNCLTWIVVDPMSSELSAHLYKALDSGPWNHRLEPPTRDEQAAEVARILARACGLDPTTATTAQMDDADARFACLQCSSLDKSMSKMAYSCMTWRNAVCWIIVQSLQVI